VHQLDRARVWADREFVRCRGAGADGLGEPSAPALRDPTVLPVVAAARP